MAISIGSVLIIVLCHVGVHYMYIVSILCCHGYHWNDLYVCMLGPLALSG